MGYSKFIIACFHISDLQYKPEALFDRLVGSASEGDEDAKPRDQLWKMFQCHAELLDDHSLRLEENVTKIEIIREMLDDKKGKFRDMSITYMEIVNNSV